MISRTLQRYVSVVVLQGPEQLLSEGVQAGRDGEGDDSAPACSRLGLRTPLDRSVVSHLPHLPHLASSLPCQQGQLGDQGGALSPPRVL